MWRLKRLLKALGSCKSSGVIARVGALEREQITRQKLGPEGDVSSRAFTGENLRNRISPFIGAVDRSHKIVLQSLGGFVSAPKLHAQILCGSPVGDVAGMN